MTIRIRIKGFRMNGYLRYFQIFKAFFLASPKNYVAFLDLLCFFSTTKNPAARDTIGKIAETAKTCRSVKKLRR